MRRAWSRCAVLLILATALLASAPNSIFPEAHAAAVASCPTPPGRGPAYPGDYITYPGSDEIFRCGTDGVWRSTGLHGSPPCSVTSNSTWGKIWVTPSGDLLCTRSGQWVPLTRRSNGGTSVVGASSFDGFAPGHVIRIEGQGLQPGVPYDPILATCPTCYSPAARLLPSPVPANSSGVIVARTTVPNTTPGNTNRWVMFHHFIGGSCSFSAAVMISIP